MGERLPRGSLDGTALRMLPAGVEMLAQFGRFSDDQLARKLPSGAMQPYFQDRPVWLVTFSGPGVQMPDSGPKGHVHGFNHEDNVVIDAVTGAYLLSFTYR